MFFPRSLKEALSNGLQKGNSKIYIWGKKEFSDVQAFASMRGIPISRVEDGFIRSITLGSDLTRPYSQIVDQRGIYFDPNQKSDLEYILSNYNFKTHTALLDRAEKLIKRICITKLSKYNAFPHKELLIDKTNSKMILIPGQVEDDASILWGGFGMTNASLIKTVRANNPSACLIYKPHPDVLAKNRKGHLEHSFVLRYCDYIAEYQSIDSCLKIIDEVHTITSLVGFDGLIRGKKVVTYGLPFYAGWGLTKDKHASPRRTRCLELNELVAGTLILYPRYIHPKTKKRCEVELMLDALEKEQKNFFQSLLNTSKVKKHLWITKIYTLINKS